MEPITLEHIRQAAEWAKETGQTPRPIDGLTRSYSQTSWDCGTSCCMWGAASIIAGCGPTKYGPSDEWAAQSPGHKLAAAIMNSGKTTPEQMLALFDLNLSEANLSEVNLSGANLSGANLSRADLSRADLSRADLSMADLSRADLSRANLSRANLFGADLSRADLSRANLFGADLFGANLSGANLSGANLSEANLSRADLSGAAVFVGNRVVTIH